MTNITVIYDVFIQRELLRLVKAYYGMPSGTLSVS